MKQKKAVLFVDARGRRSQRNVLLVDGELPVTQRALGCRGHVTTWTLEYGTDGRWPHYVEIDYAGS